MIKFAPFITIYGLNEYRKLYNEVIWVFSKHLKHTGTRRQRLNIHITQRKNEERVSLDRSIKSVWVYLNKEIIDVNTIDENKHLFLNLITNVFLDIADHLDWDRTRIQDAKNKSLEDNLIFTHESRGRYNKTKSYREV